MTTEQLDAMRAGRERYLAEQRDEATQLVRAYRDWVKAESKLFEAREVVARELGRNSEQYESINRIWNDYVGQMPPARDRHFRLVMS